MMGNMMMNGWGMGLGCLFLLATLGFVIYLAVRFGVRDGLHDRK